MRKIKMVLYADAGVGKSVFASKSPNPFFITTDGNYEWLLEFGAKIEDHVRVDTWREAKKILAGNFDGYDTIVIDLLEDLYMYAEHEFTVANKLQHIGDLGYGKGYHMVRDEFFREIAKLINKDKNIILIMHSDVIVEKDRRGVELYKYIPSKRMSDVLRNKIEGRVRYFVRAYLTCEEGTGGKLIKKRWLSIVPKENEFGVIRGVDENTIPHDIPLEWTDFVETIGLAKGKKEAIKKEIKSKIEIANEVKIVPLPAKVDDEVEIKPLPAKVGDKVESVPLPAKAVEEVEFDELPFEVEEPNIEVTIKEEPVKEEQTNDDKIEALRKKLAMIKANKN